MTEPPKKPPFILYAEDDDDDYLLVKDAFQEAGFKGEIFRVRDGEELMNYLLRQGPFQNREDHSQPMIVLLDLNMPRKDGREALKEMKSHPELRRIVVVVLTTSRAQEDVFRTFDMGVNSFIRKPLHFDKFVEMAGLIEKYWFEVSILPGA
ncbi:MAG: response regulator [Candidatus Omnitrophota bacterium]